MAKAEAARVLDIIVCGEGAQANALQQLLTLHRSDPRPVLAALSQKVNAVVANADSGAFSAQAGALLVNAATFLDQQSASGDAVGKALLDHVLQLTGGPGRAAKDTSVRSQGCAFVAALCAAAPEHAGAEAKLIEFSLDRVPSIRERAIRGLGSLARSIAVEQALLARTTDPFAPVRSAATGSLRVSAATAPVMLKRIDDVEATVRAQLFHTLRAQPQALQELGPVALARVCAAVTDRSAVVRAASSLTIEAWREKLGGALALLMRCDVTGDEALANAAASALAVRFPDEGKAVARDLFGAQELTPAMRRKSRGVASTSASLALFEKGGVEGYCVLLFARHALATMPEDKRDELLDVPLLLRRCLEALGSASSREHGVAYLKQLLFLAAQADLCEDAMRACGEKLAETVLAKAPPIGQDPHADNEFGLMDLGVVLLRKCSGLVGTELRPARQQALEERCSTRVVLIVSDLCQPLHGEGGDDLSDGGNFAVRLSLKLQDVNHKIEERTKWRAAFADQKKKAVMNEEFIQAQQIKEASKKNDAELVVLKKEQELLKTERDCTLIRVLAILKALLRWSNSDYRKDSALRGILTQILQPVVSLPALSPEVELAAVTCICHLCTRDYDIAKRHWGLLLELLRLLRSDEGLAPGETRKHQARATVAARTLVDCCIVHHSHGLMEKDEIFSAAHALGAVPFYSRNIAIEPLMRWLSVFGHVFFEGHLHEPVLEVQWALGWLLVEAFKQQIQEDEEPEEPSPKKETKVKARARGTSWVMKADAKEDVKDEHVPVKVEVQEDPDEIDDTEATARASNVLRFFNLMPKLPGKHSHPMVSLAVESIAESGLWRRAVLVQKVIGGKDRWVRGFSWPQLFAFAHDRLPAEMRFRLWRCSLQLCIAEKELAPLAEVHSALIRCMKAAPTGAGALVREAVSKGADEMALAPLLAKLPGAQGPMPADAPEFLVSQEEAVEAERERREVLSQLGVQVDVWAPAALTVPGAMPAHLRMKIKKEGKEGGKKKEKNEPIVPQPMLIEEDEEAPAAAAKRRRFTGKTAPSASSAAAPAAPAGLPICD